MDKETQSATEEVARMCAEYILDYLQTPGPLWRHGIIKLIDEPQGPTCSKAGELDSKSRGCVAKR